jgi:hypothetical protein
VQANGSEDTWRSDYKFDHAVDGFSHGEKNPVPLANVSCLMARERIATMKRRWIFFERKVSERKDKFPYVAFTNGVTRTIWLAAHHAKCFPVECHVRDAPLLQECAGAMGSAWKTVQQFIPSEPSNPS